MFAKHDLSREERQQEYELREKRNTLRKNHTDKLFRVRGKIIQSKVQGKWVQVDVESGECVTPPRSDRWKVLNEVRESSSPSGHP